MGKRSDFVRNPRDFYPTPIEALAPLVPRLPSWEFGYIEPCAGNYALVNHMARLRPNAICVGAYDIEPQHAAVQRGDATSLRLPAPFMVITNPPWDRPVLHGIIDNLAGQTTCWLLLDADWMHTKQAIPYMVWCTDIVSIGRVKWIAGSKMTGKDNCAWYRFDKRTPNQGTQFHTR